MRLEAEGDQTVIPEIKDADIRCWLIIFLLSIFEKLTFKEILAKLIDVREGSIGEGNAILNTGSESSIYDDNAIINAIREYTQKHYDSVNVAEDTISVTALRKDLNSLQKQGLVTQTRSNHIYYKLTGKAPQMIAVDPTSLYDFCEEFGKSASATSGLTPLKEAYTRIKRLIAFEETDVKTGRFGKINNLNQDVINSFNRFIEYPYKTNLIRIKTDKVPEPDDEGFAVGLIFYSVETGYFYLLGRNIKTDKVSAIRTDKIQEVIVLDKTNKEFHSEKYYTLYNEIFSAAYEKKAHKVKVLYEAFSNVPKRFEDLHARRIASSIRPISDPPEGCPYKFVYEDTIRDLDGFARFLRGFGRSVLVIEPQELVTRMVKAYKSIVENYGGTNE